MARKRFYEIDDVSRIDLNQLVRWLPGGQNRFLSWLNWRGDNRRAYVNAMLDSWDVLNQHGINTPLRLAHFFAQGLIETGFLQHTSESLSYDEEGLIATFSYYRDRREEARQDARNQEVIANKVYGGRMGNTQPGDGWKYRGRGFIQLTGRDNYTRYADASGVDIVSDPDQISNRRDLKPSIVVAAAFWETNGLNAFADRNDAAAVSRGVNRGNPNSTSRAHGEDARILWTSNCLWLTESPENVELEQGENADAGSATAPDATTPVSTIVSTLRMGNRGEDVRALQEKLKALGYDVNGIDGIFGQGTHRAVVAFQEEHGLSADGVVGPATHAKIDAERDDPVRAATARRMQEGPNPFALPPVAAELAGAPDPFRS